jgi:hypothetical protein
MSKEWIAPGSPRQARAINRLNVQALGVLSASATVNFVRGSSEQI